MKVQCVFAALATAFALHIGIPVTPAEAQTQCPVGVVAGSAACAPDAPQGVDNSTRGYSERVEGLGAFAFNTETGDVYSYVLQGRDIDAARFNAMRKCEQPNHQWGGMSMRAPTDPDANCAPITAWRNACSAVASGQVGGVTRYFSTPARNARSARADALSQCQANGGGNCGMAHDAVCTARSTRWHRY
jgi:hypothetical protein